MSAFELFFLRSELGDTQLSAGFRWSLQVVKVSAEVPAAYVAFSTPGLARTYAGGSENVSVVAAAALDATHYVDFANKPIVLFESASDLERCLQDRACFPYEQHLAKFSIEQGLLRNAA